MALDQSVPVDSRVASKGKHFHEILCLMSMYEQTVTRKRFAHHF